MMKNAKRLLSKYNIKPSSYRFTKGAIIVEDGDDKYVLKLGNNKENIYNYLDARNFDYYPKLLNNNDDNYQITDYIDDHLIPKEQKIIEMIRLVGLLHSKTTYYKEIDEDFIKQIYEDISNNVEYLINHYNDLANYIETKVYMSPSEYSLIRNISKIYMALGFCKEKLEDWYELVKEKGKQRFVVLHNNLELDHFRYASSPYLISWNKAKEGLPIFDLYKLYKKHCLDFDFLDILRQYEKHYSLLKEERLLLFILISLPPIIESFDSEYDACRIISYHLDCLYKTDQLISFYIKQN